MTRITWAITILTLLILTAFACVYIYGLTHARLIIDHVAFAGGVYITFSSLRGITRPEEKYPLALARRMLRLVIGASVTVIHIMQYFRDLA